MSLTDWLQVVVALTTGLMAAATLYLGLEARRTRRQAQQQRDREAFRLALTELGAHVLAWSSGAPWSGSASERIRAPVDLVATRQAIVTVSISGDLLAYLLWSAIVIRSTSEAYLDVLNGGIPGNYPPVLSPFWASDEAQDLYAATVDQMALVGRLFCAEAGHRGFEEIPAAFNQQFEFRPRRTAHWNALETYGRPLPDAPVLPRIGHGLHAVPAVDLGIPLSPEIRP